VKEGLLSVKAVKSLELPLDQRDLIVRSVKDGYFSLDVSSRRAYMLISTWGWALYSVAMFAIG
jgi:hypothetical protein